MIYISSADRRIAVSVAYERRVDHESMGKWIVRGRRGHIGGLFKKVRELVLQDRVYEAKFKKSKMKKGLWMLLVYADAHTKDDTRQALEEIDIYPRVWANNSQSSRVSYGKLRNFRVRMW